MSDQNTQKPDANALVPNGAPRVALDDDSADRRIGAEPETSSLDQSQLSDQSTEKPDANALVPNGAPKVALDDDSADQKTNAEPGKS